MLARRLDRPPIIEMTDKDVLNIPGSEWAIFRLGTMSTIVSIDIDTNHFKGNAPEYITVEGTQRGEFDTSFKDDEWVTIIEKIKLQPHKLHSFKKEIKNSGPFNCIRIIIAPDGGISRIRINGQVSQVQIESNDTAAASKPETAENNESNDIPTEVPDDAPPSNSTSD